MADLSAFPVSRLFPVQTPDVIQLYSLATPNGVKVSIALEELGLAYEVHKIDISTDIQKHPDFLALNPNGRIPAIIDPNGPDGKPIGLFESGAILIYLAEKTGKLLSNDPALRYETLCWLMWQMGGVGPMFGQFGHFYKYAADKVANNPYPTERYKNETRRLLGILEERLADRQFLVNEEYTIADIAIFPWVRSLTTGYGAAEALNLTDFPKTEAWVQRLAARPAAARGLNVPSRA